MSPKPREGFSLALAVAFYALAGAVHELSHVACARFVSKTSATTSLWRALASRSVAFDDPAGGTNLEIDDPLAFARVRWTGAAVSAILVVFVEVTSRRRGRKGTEGASAGVWSAARVGFWATAIDALCTDVFDALPRRLGTALCGNFGIILINAAWAKCENGVRAFDVLEKMVYVTMMRGAQSGGVVTFNEDGKQKSKMGDKVRALRGSRSRVVNMKRTDLSKLVRAKAERESGGKRMGNQDVTRIFAGHTRFATTSKATFDGTHPHQWSVPQMCRVYSQNQKTPVAESVNVENFITHNGDFDFYQINGHWYELGEIQVWLKLATGFDAPSAVDSAAIAGVVDLLRAQGCFALAARYAVCFALKTSDASRDAPIPTLAKFEEIGTRFERVLDEILASGTHTVRDLGFKLNTRELLTDKILSAFEQSTDGALDCLKYYIDEEMGAR